MWNHVADESARAYTAPIHMGMRPIRDPDRESDQISPGAPEERAAHGMRVHEIPSRAIGRYHLEG